MKSTEGTSCLSSVYEQLSPLGVNTFFHRSLCLRSQGSGCSNPLLTAPCLVNWCSLMTWVLIPRTSVRFFKPLCFVNVLGCFHLHRNENDCKFSAIFCTSYRCSSSDQLLSTSQTPPSVFCVSPVVLQFSTYTPHL